MFPSPTHAAAEVKDKINYRGEEFVISSALMMDMDNIILNRIAFGGGYGVGENLSKPKRNLLYLVE
jgi:hypothetical protein